MGLFDKIFKKKVCAPPVPQQLSCKNVELPATTAESEPAQLAGSSVSTPADCVEEIGGIILSRLDFGKPAGALGCFLNYEPRMLCVATDRQLSYLENLGVDVPEGTTKEDAACMISRAIGEDDIKSPSAPLVALAVELGVKFSAFEGARGLLACMVSQVSERDRAALFAYCVKCSKKHVVIGNMTSDPQVSTFYSFADRVVADPALLRSLNGRSSDDFREPHHGTAIYKAAALALSGGGV